MARTTATKVQQIIDTDLSSSVIDAYITGANAVVSEVIGTDTTLSSTLKEEIERWFTAHMIAATRERQPAEAEAGPAKIKYQGVTGKGLQSTMYGQQVLAMDSTGKFAKLGQKQAEVTAILSWDD